MEEVDIYNTDVFEKRDHLRVAIYAPLDPVNTPEEAFECNNACGEKLCWNTKTNQLECWNPYCEMFQGTEEEKQTNSTSYKQQKTGSIS